MSLLLRILGPNAWVTIIRYVLTAVGGFLIAKGFLDETSAVELQDAVLGVAVILINAFFGAKSSVTPKVVTKDGVTVKQSKMPIGDQVAVEHAAAKSLTEN